MGLLRTRVFEILFGCHSAVRDGHVRSNARHTLGVVLAIGIVVAFSGCRSEEGGPGRFSARGVVEDVDREGGQVLIDHEDVEGLMPAMTMNFVVPDAELLQARVLHTVLGGRIVYSRGAN